jgi:scyllo-inositol 2-dehydrogenase (NADP+)
MNNNSTPSVLKEDYSMASGINTAVVGYGFAGKCFHSYLIGLADGLNLYAISTRDPGRRAAAEKDYKVKTYPTIDDLLKDDKVELVVIATPHDSHAELSIKCMNAGRHVVVDKAMCMNTAEADAMIEASTKNNVLLSVFQNRRWDSDYMTVKKAIESKLMGEVFLIQVAILGYGRPGGWRSVKKSFGGQIYDWGAHLVDQCLRLVPSKVDTVFCDSHHIWDVDVESHLNCIIRFQNGVSYGIELSNICRIKKPRWLVLGDKGTLCKYGLDPQEPAMIRCDIDAAVYNPDERPKVITEIDGEVKEMSLEYIPGNWKAYYQNIADVINKGAELAVKPEEARENMRLIDAIIESAEKGTSVKMNQ